MLFPSIDKTKKICRNWKIFRISWNCQAVWQFHKTENVCFAKRRIYLIECKIYTTLSPNTLHFIQYFRDIEWYDELVKPWFANSGVYNNSYWLVQVIGCINILNGQVSSKTNGYCFIFISPFSFSLKNKHMNCNER